MQYLGGKTRLARHLVSAMQLSSGTPVWEPFCGGLSMTVEMANAGCDVLASDIHRPLISLYKHMQDGWQPPKRVSEKTYKRAKHLPDSDPLKAFVGFGCSFGGKYFGGMARDRQGTRDLTNEAYHSITRKFESLEDVVFKRKSFFDRKPRALEGVIYCDPPYAGTTQYKGTPSFNTAAFWILCQWWASLGVTVYVSEFTCPVPHSVVWERDRVTHVDSSSKNVRRERLYRVRG